MERSYTSTETGEEVKVKSKSELLMSAMAIIPDDSTITSPDFKNPGDLVYVIGETRDELGASEFYARHNEVGRNVPVTDLPEIKTRYEDLSVAIKMGIVHSCQYVGRGGLAAAISNCAIAGDLGAKITLDSIDKLGRADKILFSETTGRFVVTVPKSKRADFEFAMGDYAVEVGEVRLDKEVCIRYKGKNVVSTTTDELRECYKGEIRF
jgi:phosphoribosylformylglycinamidine synthase